MARHIAAGGVGDARGPEARGASVASGASRTIRRFEPRDTEGLIDVWLASTIEGQSFLPKAHWRAMEPTVRDELLPAAEAWVVEEDGELVAFMAILGDLIGGLFTRPDRQGRGHGRALIEHARSTHAQVFVEVFEANARAVDLYRRCGFVDHDRHRDDTSGLPLLILRLDAPPDGRP